MLSDGSIVRLGPKTEAEAQTTALRVVRWRRRSTARRSSFAPGVPGRLRTLASHLAASLRLRPQLPHRLPSHRPPSWYADPDPYPPDQGLNLATLLCGSEGTLACRARARLRLVPRPQGSAVVLLAFSGIAEACDAAHELLGLRPAAVELVPRSLLDRAATVPEYARKSDFAPPGAAGAPGGRIHRRNARRSGAAGGTLARPRGW